MESVHYAHYSNTSVISDALWRSHQTKLNNQQGSSTWSLQCWGWWYSMKTDLTTETCTNSTPQTTNGETEPPGVTTANTNALSAVVYYAECDTGYSHTSPPTPACKHTASTKYNLQCSEEADEKDSLDKFWQIYQQTQRAALCAHGLCARCFVSWWQSAVPVLL